VIGADADRLREETHVTLERDAHRFLVWCERRERARECGAGHFDGEEPDAQK